MRGKVGRTRIQSVFLASLFVFIVEMGTRIMLGTWRTSLLVLTPPIILITFLGINSLFTNRQGTPMSWVNSFSIKPLRKVGIQLGALSILGHILAITLGAALFLISDTILRYVLYSLGYSLPWELVTTAPLIGVAHGAFIIWGPLLDTVQRVANGERIVVAGRSTLSRALGNPQWLVRRLLFHTAIGGFVVFTIIVGFEISGVYLVLLPLFGILSATLYIFISFDNIQTKKIPEMVVPGKHFVVLILVFILLTSSVSAIRLTETRPERAETTALPDKPDEMYRVAASNTENMNHAIIGNQTSEHNAQWTIAVDRLDREARITAQGLPGMSRYQSAGTSLGGATPPPSLFALSGGRSGKHVAGPGYWMFQEGYSITAQPRTFPSYVLPHAGTEGWRVIERDDGMVELELTNSTAVFHALGGDRTISMSNGTGYVRVHIDSSSGTITGGEVHLNVTPHDRRIQIHRTYVVETGSEVNVSRPDELPRRTFSEWAWKLFAY